MPIPLAVALVTTAAPIITGAIASHKANVAAGKAKDEAEAREKTLASLEASRQDITNPYANLSVATQAAELQLEEVDSSLATTLDTIQAMGTAAGSATALAQAAAKSKMQISAGIEQQEVKNQQLMAQGEQFVFQVQEQREMQQLDRAAGLLERAQAQELQYRSDSMAALTGGITGASTIAGSIDWSKVGKS
jgi:hypothetical protein